LKWTITVGQREKYTSELLEEKEEGRQEEDKKEEKTKDKIKIRIKNKLNNYLFTMLWIVKRQKSMFSRQKIKQFFKCAQRPSAWLYGQV